MEKLCKEVDAVFCSYNVNACCDSVENYSNFIIFNIKILKGCRIKQLEAIAKEMQLLLRLDSVPVFISDVENGIIKMISVKKNGSVVKFSDVLSAKKSAFDFPIGIDVTGKVTSIDITKAPHVLVAGTTGSGKSVFMHNIIANIMHLDYSSLYLIDPKHVEFQEYKKVYNYDNNIENVVNSYSETVDLLNNIQKRMENRYKYMSENGFTDISQSKYRRVFVVIDEFADLVAQDKSGKFKDLLCSIASKSRASGIHLIIATQRPSVDVVSGLIKANFPSRVIFKVSSGVDSRVVIDQSGAENLTCNGDGILYGFGRSEQLCRFKSALVSSDDAFKHQGKFVVPNKTEPKVFVLDLSSEAIRKACGW